MSNIANAPVKNTTPVDIQLADMDDAREWDSMVKPFLPPGRTTYDWTQTLRFMPRLRYLVFARYPLNAYALKLVTADQAGFQTLAGLMLVVEGVEFPGGSDKCLYVWYLAAAPEAYLKSENVLLIPKAGEVLLDAALVASRKAGFGGRMFLHADPSGGNDLLRFYEKVGLKRVDSTLNLGISFKKNDGRYFYADEPIAAEIIQRNNRFR